MSVPTSIIKGLWKHKGEAAMIGFGVWSGMDSYEEARRNGDGIFSSALQGAAYGIVSSTGWGALALSAYELSSLGYDMYQSQRSMLRQQSAQGQVPFANASFRDQPQFATMRQAGMALAKKSEYNLQQAQLGNEARFMHRE